MKKLVMMLTLLMLTGTAYAETDVCKILRAQGDPCTAADQSNSSGSGLDVSQLPMEWQNIWNGKLPGLNQLPNLGQNGNGLKFSVCINGINLLGESCQGDTWGDWNRPRQFKATGRDAVEVIRNSKIITSGFDNQGWALFVVTYHGKYVPAKGKTFSCRVSPDARQFLCISWVPSKVNH